MSNRKPSTPNYRLHKGSGQALVQLGGRRIYLGVYGTEESKEAYRRHVAEWLSRGAASEPPPPKAELTVVELIDQYWQQHVINHYVKDGRASDHQDALRAALRPVKEAYGSTPAADFGPLALKAVRQTMIEAGLARSYINHNVGHIRRMFRWAVSEELLPPSTYQALATVQGLQAGRTKARETKPIPPADDAIVDATLPHLPAVVADMVRLQRLIGCRPGELCQMRPRDVDTSGAVWCYTPESHKTEHHGKQRRIYIGPKGQDILRPYLLRAHDAYCFSPADSEKKRHEAQREKRKTRVQPSQHGRRGRKSKPKQFRNHYSKDAYNVAIRRACSARAGLKRPRKPKDKNDQAAQDAYRMALKEYNAELALATWKPNQLRHAVATDIRKRYGLEAAQTVLGHSKADVTQVYAERDFALAARVMGEVG